MSNIANNIIKLRKECGYSQESLAEKLNVSRQAVSKWERDEAVPDVYNLQAIAKVFNVTIEELIDGEDVAAQTINEAPKQSELVKTNIKQRAHIYKAIAITLMILGGIAFLYLDGNNDLDLLIGGVLVAIGVGLSIYATNLNHYFRQINEEYYHQFESEHERKPNLVQDKILPIVSICAVISYLVLGFVFGLWHPGWIVFLAIPLVATIGNLFEKDKVAEK